MARARRPRAVLGAALIFVALMVVSAPPASADPGDIGRQDQSFTGFTANTPPSGTKPESKLWWNDGYWWANMFDTVSGDFHIFRLDTATQAWVDTGVATDPRTDVMSDVLWDGTKLYVATHVFQDNGSTTGFQSRLYRYGYNAATDTYTLDPGFPVQINNVKTETLVIDKDSTGQLFATWTEGSPKTVWVSSTVCSPGCNDATWGAPFQLSADPIASDDISSVVAFGAPGSGKIGVMWSDQNGTNAYRFAVHNDADPDTTWGAPEAALTGASLADDHVNLKADADGRVYATAKTRLSGSSPLIYLLVRPVAGGAWAKHVFGRVSDGHTRPIVVLDTTNGLAHVFATQPDAGGTVYEKTLALSLADTDGADFDLASLGIARIKDASALKMNNPTSTKQSVSSATGLAVLATNKKTDVTPKIRDYWHHYDALAGGDTTAPVLQDAQVNGSNLALTYTETLDSASVPAASAFTVKVDGVTRGVTLVSISGSLVTLTLASPVIQDEVATVGYTPPATGPLQDLAGNDAGTLTDAPVTNNTPGGTAFNLLPNGDGTRDSAITGTNGVTTNLFTHIDEGITVPDDDASYVNNASNASGSYFALLIDTPSNFASLTSLTIDLRAKTVNRVDDDTAILAQVFKADETTPLSNEVAVAVNPGAANWMTIAGVPFTGLAGGTRADWDGARLRLRWQVTPVGGLDGSNRLRITAVELHAAYATVPDTTLPVFQSAQVNGATLTMTYDEALDPASVPAASAFTVKVTGAARGVSTVGVSGSAVTLTLASPVVAGEVVTVSYAPPGTNPVQDVAGNNAAALTDAAVTNSTPGGGGNVTLLPNGDGTRGATITAQGGGTTNLFASIDDGIATPDDGTTYVRNNAATSGSYFALVTDMPASFGSMSTLTIDARMRTVNRVDDTIRVFAQAFKADEATPLSNEVQLALNPGTWTTFSNIALTGLVPGTKADWDGARVRLRWLITPVGSVDPSPQTPVTAIELHGTFAPAGGDTTPPVFQSAQVNGATLTMTYGEALDPASVPAASAFTVKVTGAARGVSTVGISGSAVTLTLASPVVAGEVVTVSYAPPGTSPVQDVAGNDAAALTDAAVTNSTPGGGGNVTLLPNGDGTRDATIRTAGGGTTSLFASIDDGIATPDDVTSYIRNDGGTTGSYFALLTDMPASFGAMSTLTIDARLRTVNRVDDTITLFAQVFKADEATPLSSEVQVAANPGTSAWTTLSGVALTGLVPGTKADWDGARVRLRWAITPIGTADGSIQTRLTAVELDGAF